MQRVSGPKPAAQGQPLAENAVAQHVASIDEFGYTVVENVRLPPACHLSAASTGP